jgi:DNA polymerase bacteriophage-type
LLLDRIRDKAKLAKCSVGDALATLMRPVIQATRGNSFAIVDYASVEARGTAWIADDEKALAIYRDTSRDVYCETASVIYNRKITKEDKVERGLGKIIELACGYSMGPNKFAQNCKLQGVDLAKAGVTAKQCVETYRTIHEPIVNAWHNLQRNAMRAIQQGKGSYQNHVFMDCVGSTFTITLPSGRVLNYRDAKITKETPIWGGSPIDQITYASPHGFRKHLYGGLLMENIVQAMCRDFLAISLVLIDNIVLHVHDEIVCEVPDEGAKWQLEFMAKTMSRPPNWAKSFPLRVEGFTNRYYMKSPIPGSWCIDAMNGEILKEHQI